MYHTYTSWFTDKIHSLKVMSSSHGQFKSLHTPIRIPPKLRKVLVKLFLSLL